MTKRLLFCLMGMIFLQSLSAQEGWTTVPGPELPGKRHENAFTKAGDRFYLLGSRGIKPVEAYDPATGSWTAGANAPLPISHFQAVSHQGLIYVLGALVGDWPSETPLSHILIYDPLQDFWTIGPEIPMHRRRGAAAAVVYNDKIYLVCGIVNGHTSGWVSWMDVFDPATNSWSELPDAPRPRDHVQGAIVNDQLVLTGGRMSGYQGQGLEATIAETDVYDFKTGSWRTLASPQGDIPTQRAGCTAITVENEVIVIGGESGSQVPAHSEVEALNIETGTWRTLPSLKRGRHGTQVLRSAGKLYIAAGCGNRGGSPELDSFEMYDLPGVSDSEDTPLTPGTLEISAKELEFTAGSGTGEVVLSNTGGEQGIPLVYAVVSGNPSFELEFPYGFPYVLAPGKKVTLKIQYKPEVGTTGDGILMIKRSDAGKVQPVEIALKRK